MEIDDKIPGSIEEGSRSGLSGQDEIDIIPMKCRKCRFVLLKYPEVRVEDSHGVEFGRKSNKSSTAPACKTEVWYIPENCMPEWISNHLGKGEWVKGKMNCPKCQARIGAYDFVSGLRCPCRSEVVPPIHIVKSKVDFTEVFQVSTRQIHQAHPESCDENNKNPVSIGP